MKPRSESLNQNLNTSLDWLLIVCGSWWSFVDFLWETLKCLEPQFLQSRSHRMTQLKLDFLRKSIRTTAARLSREEVKRWRSRVQTPPEDLQSPDDKAYETSNTAGKLRYRRRVTQRKVSKDASKQTTISNTTFGTRVNDFLVSFRPHSLHYLHQNISKEVFRRMSLNKS